MSLHQSVWSDCEQSGRDTSHIIFHRDNKYLPSTHQAPCETKGGQVDANSLVSVNIGWFTDFFYFFLCEDNISHFFYTILILIYLSMLTWFYTVLDRAHLPGYFPSMFPALLRYIAPSLIYSVPKPRDLNF